jgi:hypothetical protein
VLYPFLILSLATVQVPAPKPEIEAPRAVQETKQDPTKPAPRAAPQQGPKAGKPPATSRATPSRPSPGTARPQSPGSRPSPNRAGPAPRATGEPKLKRRGS